MGCNWDKRAFGATGLQVSGLGLGSSYGLGADDVERAYERGVNLMFWGARRRDGFGDGVKRIAAKDREGVVIAVQSYTRVASLMRTSTECALRTLGVDHVDMLCLAWWDEVPPQRIIDAALKLKDEGKVGHLLISCHHRPSFDQMIQVPGLEAIMLRYNAAHPGAEQDVFAQPAFTAGNPGVLAFTATRWGSLLNPKLVPDGEPTPRASDCYRFALSNPHVHATLAGPKNGEELDEAMAALDRGPLTDDEMAWMRRVGKAVRNDAKAHAAIGMLDRVRTAVFGAPASITLPP